MLGKLLKYEIKATARTFIPMYIGLILFAGINKLFLLIDVENRFISTIQGLSVFAYVMIIIVTMGLTVFVIIQRFYKNLMSDEGYLMMTLPVKSHMHIFSKLISSIMWILISCAITGLSLLILFSSKELFASISNLIALGNMQLAAIGMTVNGLLGWICIVAVAGMIYGILLVYTSISIGQLAPKNKVLSAFAAFLILNMIMQAIFMLSAFVPVFSDLMTDDISLSQIAIFGSNMEIAAMEFADMIIAIICGVYLAVAAGYFFVTNYILKKKLNLE